MTLDRNGVVADVRSLFAHLHRVWETNGARDDEMLEIIGASFIADESTIFGSVNRDYVRREIDWYDSRSLSVHDFPGVAPFIWRQVASTSGHILSNYGHLLYSDDNFSQYENVRQQLAADPSTRRAVAIYTRPSVHEEWHEDGMSDFICTNAVHYFIRGDSLDVVVQMRSNDAIFGYRNDYAWQSEVQLRLLSDLADQYPKLTLGQITWQAASLHIYPRHFDLVSNFRETGEYDVAV